MSTQPSAPGRERSMLTFDDLAQDLVWPRMLRAGVLALYPLRLLLALAIVGVVLGLLWLLYTLESSLGWTGSEESRDHLARLIAGPDPHAWFGGVSGERVVDVFFSIPLQLVRVHPLATSVGGLVGVMLVVLGIAAISRSAATEFAAGRAEPVLETLRFARERSVSLLGAVLGPILFVWGVALVLAIGGLLLLRWPGVNLIGAVLYGLALAAGFFAAFILLVYAVGKPLLVPAVCCDGADALDAIQRAYSYVLAKPLRLTLYLAILIAQGALLLFIIALFCGTATAFAAHATGKWAGEDGRRMAFGERSPDAGTFNAGAAVVRAWNAIPGAIPLAFLLSYCACGGTVLYLGMRRVCDGQDMNELWSPQEDRPGALGAGALPTDTDADAE